MPISRARSAGLAVAVLAPVASGATAVAAARGSDDTITACANLRTGALRLETAKLPCVTKALSVPLSRGDRAAIVLRVVSNAGPDAFISLGGPVSVSLGVS